MRILKTMISGIKNTKNACHRAKCARKQREGIISLPLLRLGRRYIVHGQGIGVRPFVYAEVCVHGYFNDEFIF